jgi:hypothetical protein
MTDRLDDRLTALHIANASDTSLRLEREEVRPWRPRHGLIAILGAALGWLLIFIIAYGLYLLSHIFTL